MLNPRLDFSELCPISVHLVIQQSRRSSGAADNRVRTLGSGRVSPVAGTCLIRHCPVPRQYIALFNTAVVPDAA